MKTVIKLNQVQTAKLYNWMDQNKKRATEGTGEEVADKASKELGFPISYATVSSLRRQMGLSPRSVKGDTLTGQIAVLANEIVLIRKELGSVVSQPLMELVKDLN